ncbi:MAG TPA: hypothetical protein VER17_02920 [Tepidisphaeraceae bacterium]|nr:hypothetical protein [Tepidisphaeraceae bacterium]
MELRKPGAPRIDAGGDGAHPEVAHLPGALGFNFNRDLAVVYGTDATGWEVESAWLLYQTLESATGRPTKIFQLDQLPPDLRTGGNLVLVGTPKTHRLVEEARQVVEPKDAAWVAALGGGSGGGATGSRLIVVGDDEAAVNRAAIDLVLRYWKHAKDSGMRRVPLTDKPIESGADPKLLP